MIDITISGVSLADHLRDMTDMQDDLDRRITELATRIAVLEMPKPPVVIPPADPTPDPTPDPAPVGTVRPMPKRAFAEAIVPYVGNNPVWSASRAKSLGVEAYGAHYMAAPSDGYMPNLNGYLNVMRTTTDVMGALITSQTYDDRPFAPDLSTRVAAATPGRRKPDSDIAAQALAYQQALSSDHLDELRKRQGVVINQMLDVVPWVALEAPGQECNGSWQGHAPFVENVELWKEMAKAHHDVIFDSVAPEKRDRLFWVLSFAKRSSRPGLTLPAIWYGDDVSPVTGENYINAVHSNVYLDVADAAWKDPARPFQLLPEFRRPFVERLLGFSFGAIEVQQFAHEHGRPFGMGESAPGLGKPGETSWVGDDYETVRLFLSWVADVADRSGPGLSMYGPFISSSGGVGSKWPDDLPEAWRAFKDVLSASRQG